MRVGVIGLGTGTLAAYGRPGDYYRFYEINPLVMDRLARVHLSHGLPSEIRCRARRRAAFARARARQQFDVLAVDAFSSDSIPVHLLTREAFHLYFRHLRPDGILAVHVSNSHLELEPVVQRAAEALGKRTFLWTPMTAKPGLRRNLGTGFARPETLSQPAFKVGTTNIAVKPGFRPWTDDYSNLFQILK